MNLSIIGNPGQATGDASHATAIKAFADHRDRRFHFNSGTHAAALKALLEALEDGSRSFASLTGQPGSGKTYLRTLLHAALDPARFIRVSIESSLLDFDQLLLEIISQAGGRRVATRELPDRYARLAELKRLLSQRAAHAGRRMAVLIDEAQGLGAETLERLRLLSNISTEQGVLMTFVLFGGPALEFGFGDSPELAQRLDPRLTLEPLADREVAEYVRHRLRVAGSGLEVRFSDTGWQSLVRFSRGLPRLLNLAMRRAIHAAGTGATLLDDRCLDGLEQAGNFASDDPTAFA